MSKELRSHSVCALQIWAGLGTAYTDFLFTRRRFDRQVTVVCILRYVTFKLSHRDLIEMMAERKVSISHTMILCWLAKFAPAAEKLLRWYARPVGGSWRVDKAYFRVKGR